MSIEPLNPLDPAATESTRNPSINHHPPSKLLDWLRDPVSLAVVPGLCIAVPEACIRCYPGISLIGSLLDNAGNIRTRLLNLH